MEHRQIARFAFRIGLVALPRPESSLNFVEIPTRAHDENGCCAIRRTERVETFSLRPFAMYGINDDERRAVGQAHVGAPRHLGVRTVAHAVVVRDIRRESGRALDPSGEVDAELLVDVTTSD